jgi:hypothetical protein
MVVASVQGNLAHAQATERDDDTIRVISVSQVVDFPSGIWLELEAEADSDIVDIKIVYRIAKHDSTVYGYPEFIPGQRVKSRFKIPTNGSSYMPSGVRIQYHYIVRDAKGVNLKSPTYGFVYLDPRHDWREYRVGFINLLTHGIPGDTVVEIALAANDRLEEMRGVYGLDVVQSKTGVIFNNRREAGQGFPLVSNTARAEHVYGGFAFSEFDLFALVGLDSNGMVHEMSHLLLHDAVDNPVSMIPAWLNEGLAMYFEGTSSHRQLEVEKAIREGRLLYLRNMNLVPGRPEDVRLFYAQSWSIVAFMFESYGSNRMTDLIMVINEGARVDDAIKEVFGITIDQLEGAWNTKVTSQTPLASKPDLLTISSYFLVAMALVFSTTVLALHWTIRRVSRSRRDEDLSAEQI